MRHGETDWNNAGRLQGREDIPLNHNGILQAGHCALALKKRRWDAIFSSPLLRAKQTADIIADINDVRRVYEDADLIERDYGKASGLTPEERNILFPDGNYKGIEEWETLKSRVYNAVLRCANGYYENDINNKNNNIIIVSHGSAINSILAYLSNHEIGTDKTRLINMCLNMLEYKDGVLRILFYNKSADEADL